MSPMTIQAALRQCGQWTFGITRRSTHRIAAAKITKGIHATESGSMALDDCAPFVACVQRVGRW
jgi:hypothetical protein